MALLVAPILMVAVIFLGRYMRSGQRGAGEDAAGSEPGLVMRALGRALALRCPCAPSCVPCGPPSGPSTGRVSACWGPFGATMRLLRGDAASAALRRVLGALLVVVPVAVITFVELYPFYWIGITAFKTNLGPAVPLRLLARPRTLEHFRWLFLESSFRTWLRNTVTTRRGRHRDRGQRLRPGGLRPGAPALAGGRLYLHRHPDHLLSCRGSCWWCPSTRSSPICTQ